MLRFLRSFAFAFRGIASAARGRNFRVMIGCGVVAVATGAITGLSALEWAAVSLSIGAVLAVEAVNTAIEKLADAVDMRPNAAIGEVKDLAAGASLLIAVGAAAVAVAVIGPHVWGR